MNELDEIREQMKKVSYYEDAARGLTFDQSTVCPEEAMEEKNEIIAFLEQQAFLLRRSSDFSEKVRHLYEKRGTLGEWEEGMIQMLFRQELLERNLTPEKAFAFSLTEKKAFVDWSHAKEASDFSLFRDSLASVIAVNQEKSALRVLTEEEKPRIKTNYDRLLDLFERGMTEESIDPLFEETKERLGALVSRIRGSRKHIRTDFLSRRVPEEEQRRVTAFLMELQGFDQTRGTWSESEHAYTERLSRNDIRITTHIYPERFLSNIYTTLHETGHAIFDQRQPKESSDYFLTESKTFGMHESVSRFYENILGRSEEFLSFIYPKLKELMPEALSGVSERELYEAANLVTPSLIRTEADEVTYAFHVIIRYELEKELFHGKLSVDALPAAWKEKYREYLGVAPENDREGVLQDVHWTSDFGYFPTYLLGNFYNAMYYRSMQEEIDVPGALRRGDFSPMNDWMERRIFRKADLLTPAEWIRDITGRDLTADDFLTYLEQKYEKLYEL